MVDAPSWIAIVDDDSSVLKALARLLRARAFEPRTFASAQAFLEALPQGRPECLIVDLQMPGMSGLELLQHLARIGERIPAIVITAHDEVGMRERCQAAGAIAFLTKPLQDAPLFAAIAEAGRIARGRRGP